MIRTGWIAALAWVLASAPLLAGDKPGPGPDLPAEVYRERRQRLMQELGDGVLLLFAAPVAVRNGDVEHDYRQHSDLYYLTGWKEPHTVAVLEQRKKKLRYTLLVRERDPRRELWDGPVMGTMRARSLFLADEAHAWKERQDVLRRILKGYKRVFLHDGGDREHRREVEELLPRSVRAEDPRPALQALRRIKDPHEQALLRRACAITAEAHRQAALHCAPGRSEAELQAVIEYTYRASGSPRVGFPSIVGSGPNSCILHWIQNDRTLQNGDLVLMDIGAEYGFYTADVTRTIPVNGKFTEDQAAIYDIVLRAQRAAIEACRPGVPYAEVSQAATQVLTEGLEQLGLGKGRRALRRFFPHGLSHWLGLDVHDDCGSLYSAVLEPGMVFTLEPGLYIPADMDGVDPRWWNIGVRIEDDVLITESGCEVLSADAPREIAEIEALMAEQSPWPVFAPAPESGEGSR